ncbi:MAG: hypothetical protein DRO14_01385 [Thermoprotei archaeon]|nr:MAG: hypothetical protein DRO14_01385 [Thermoprotei archaeon]
MRRKATVLELEGLAINNLIKSYEVSECHNSGKLKFLKVIARTLNDEELETECMDQDRIGRVIAILASYRRWGK